MAETSKRLRNYILASYNNEKNTKLSLLNKDLYRFCIPYENKIYAEILNVALLQYSAALLNEVKFEIVNCENEADFIIHFNDFKQEAVDNNIYVNINDIYHNILHEIGHIIGLGHSPFANDVMTEQKSSAVKLTENDIFVIRLLYFACKNKTYKESEKYISKCIKEFIKLHKLKNDNNKFSLGYNFDISNNLSKYIYLINDINNFHKQHILV